MDVCTSAAAVCCAAQRATSVLCCTCIAAELCRAAPAPPASPPVPARSGGRAAAGPAACQSGRPGTGQWCPGQRPLWERGSGRRTHVSTGWLTAARCGVDSSEPGSASRLLNAQHAEHGAAQHSRAQHSTALHGTPRSQSQSKEAQVQAQAQHAWPALSPSTSMQGLTRKVDHGGAGVGLDAGVCKVVHQAHDCRQDLGVLLLLQRSRDAGRGARRRG